MTGHEFSDAGDEPGGSDDFDNAEPAQWASHDHHAGPTDPSEQTSIAPDTGRFTMASQRR
jgi:hypothetical protein